MSDYEMYIDHNKSGLTELDKNFLEDIHINFGKVLSEMKDNRVFDIWFYKDENTDHNSINYSEGEFRIAEMCDEYFGARLTLERCEDLSRLFDYLAEYYKIRENRKINNDSIKSN